MVWVKPSSCRRTTCPLTVRFWVRTLLRVLKMSIERVQRGLSQSEGAWVRDPCSKLVFVTLEWRTPCRWEKAGAMSRDWNQTLGKQPWKALHRAQSWYTWSLVSGMMSVCVCVWQELGRPLLLGPLPTQLPKGNRKILDVFGVLVALAKKEVWQIDRRKCQAKPWSDVL